MRRRGKGRRIIALVLAFVAFLFLTGSKTALGDVSPEHLQEINQLWQGSVHALAEVNCSSCHQDKSTQELLIQPTQESCRSCHEMEVDTFLLGKHGIRTLEGLSPLTPAMAHLPMKESALAKQMNCNTCHNVHSVNTWEAAVDSCLGCHNDSHSLNYRNSPHAQLFTKAGVLPRPNAKSVTCATCHLPRQEVEEVVHVNHNNTFTLLPRDRMVKEVCMSCHSVEYAYNSIFDDELVEGNFSRLPTQKMPTFQLIRDREKKRLSQTNNN